jgi:hypothetical protein
MRVVDFTVSFSSAFLGYLVRIYRKDSEGKNNIKRKTLFLSEI